MDIFELPKYIKGVEFFSLGAALAEFRRWLERENGTPIQDIELNAALLLHDLCRFLKLGEKQRQQVLGQSGVEFVQTLHDTRFHCSANSRGK